MNEFEKTSLILSGIILIIILVICFLKFNKFCKEKYRENLIGYRLGDMIKKEIYRSADVGFDLHHSKYPKSIATQYMKAIKSLPKDKQNNNLDILFDILKDSKYKNSKNSKNNVVIHIRTGDVIDKQKYSVDEFLEKECLHTSAKQKYNYVKSLSYYQDIVKKLISLDLPKKIMIVTGFHMKHDHKKSLQYTDRVKKYFKSKGYQVSTRINKHPDHDFVYMSTSKYFVQSGGGFSEIIGNMVRHNKGIVL